MKKIKKFDLYKLDTNWKYLKKAFDLAYEYELFSLYKFDKITQEKLKFLLFSQLTQYSGNLSFLSIQILAANSIMNKNDFKRKEHFFNKKCGIAINHLRSSKTHVTATKIEDGYLLNGNLTWASGYKIFDKLLIGFHYNGMEMEVLTSFKEEKGFKIISQPKTFVGFGLNTINIKLRNYFVKDKNIVSKNEIGNYTKNKSISKTVHYALYGLAVGALNNIDNNHLKKEYKIKIEKIKIKFLTSNDGDELDTLRVKLFNTTQKLITLGMIQNGGKSILLEQNLQRFYKELIMFNSNGLNDKLKSLFIIS